MRPASSAMLSRARRAIACGLLALSCGCQGTSGSKLDTVAVTVTSSGSGRIVASLDGRAPAALKPESGSFVLDRTAAAMVVLTAQPDAGWIFERWGGDCSNGGIVESVPLDFVPSAAGSAHDWSFRCTALFAPLPDGGVPSDLPALQTTMPGQATTRTASLTLTSGKSLYPAQAITTVTCGAGYFFAALPPDPANLYGLPAASSFIGVTAGAGGLVAWLSTSAGGAPYAGSAAGSYGGGSLPPIAILPRTGATLDDTLTLSGTYQPCP